MALTGYNDLVTSLLPPNPILKTSFTGQGGGWLHSSFYTNGLPGAAALPSPGINGAALTSYAGQLNFPATSGSTTIYLAALQFAQGGNIGGVLICDRLWHNSGIVVTTTGAQNITFPGLPARDQNGATSGVGVQVFLEVTASTTNAGSFSNMSMSYTNSAGTAGRTANISSFPANAVAGTLIQFMLAPGDVGVQSIQSITLGTSLVTGSVSLVCYRLVASVPTPTASSTALADWTQLGLPVMYNTSVPWMVYVLNGAVCGIVNGLMTYAQK
jgi:hypothetical protein